MENILKRKPYLLYIALALAVVLLIGCLQLSYKNSQLESALEQTQQQLKDTRKSEPTCDTQDAWQAGTSRSFTLTSENRQRFYAVHLPSSFTKTKYYPLIIAFGGKNEQAKIIEQMSMFSSIPAITVYPQSLASHDGTYAWQGAPYSPQVNDVAFVDTMLNEIELNLCISRNAIYTAGWSNGGGIAWLTSCQLSGRIAATAIIAGAFYPESNCEPKVSPSILNIHGDSDPMVPYFGSIKRQLPAIDRWVIERSIANGCKYPPITVSTSTVQSTTWKSCKDASRIQNIRILQGGHNWPSSLSLPSQQRDMQLNDILWRFFRRT